MGDSAKDKEQMNERDKGPCVKTRVTSKHITQARVTGTARRTGWTENELRFLAILDDFSSGMGRIPLFCKFRAEPSSGRCINPPLFISIPSLLSFDAKQSSVYAIDHALLHDDG